MGKIKIIEISEIGAGTRGSSLGKLDALKVADFNLGTGFFKKIMMLL